jgi:uncharacterized membrane protein
VTETAPDALPPGPAEEAPRTGRGRHRPEAIAGEDLSRIIALSDGVFAFALTLLVLSLAIPSVKSNGALGFALNHDFEPLYGYAFAFVMIAIWWIVHNRTYQYIARFDSGLVWINMGLLMQIAIMPFVLSVYTTYTSGANPFQYAVILFASIQIGLGLTNALLWNYAVRAKLTKPTVTPAVRRYFTSRSYTACSVFALSIAVSFWSVQAAQYTWILLFVLQRFLTIEGD